ncbi:hypothetical protein CANCADRAFT_90531 [Tortispora caseinolytica NRRL Y-17796]|uniref:t-SNARE coiled-coil homology domain-containing protein n=1 Tax=Tortispora caseinolytica NRRL Y-17796 TaxID=767744 RepID=A0A1E4TLN1_9ASCO|nr:hypothetical protein CANCADRAFT_90531 [Tortispora caseinolytica NRRL Y-17796]
MPILDSEIGSELLASYESDFKLAYAELTQKIDQATEAAASAKSQALSAAHRAFDDARELCDQIAIEIQNIPSQSRSKANSRLREYKSDLEKHKRALQDLELADQRDQLLGGPTGAAPGYSQRQQLLSDTERLEQSSDRIRQSQRVANETEQIGSGILMDLRGQRDQIINSRNTLLEADGYVDHSVRTLKGMTRRLATNRIISIAIIVVLVILILLVIVSKFW